MENKDAKVSVLERCPDLNLELTISPPRHVEPDHQQFKGGMERSLCFVCSLGLQNSKDCRCGFGTIGSTSRSGTGNSAGGAGYDFLGLKTGVWDYRSLEMK